MIHGGGPGATGWSNFGHLTEDLAADFRLIIVDLPGFGASEIIVDDDVPWCRMAAEEFVAFLEALRFPRAHIIGNSAGGTVAAHMALIKPELVASLVLMGCAGLRTPVFTPKEMPGITAMRAFQASPSLEKMRAVIHEFLYDPTLFDVEKIALERYEQIARTGVDKGTQRMARARPQSLQILPEQLAKIAAPTLLLWGREERFVGIDDALMFMACLPDARLCLLPKCGHWAMIERPDDFKAQLRGFVSMIEKTRG
jgi:4,5:9,10-diseco-3-hydroxy-5,9,17-trioxoandrosta-1(10),2-diene-4-oate hydrolase